MGQVRDIVSTARVERLHLGALGFHPTYVVLLLIALALAYWLWFGLTQRSIFQDEGISLLGAQSIVDNGYPLLPSGYVYVRGYLTMYLVAGSIFVFGLNQFSIMLPSLILGLGSLWLVYVFGRDVAGKPWVGVVAVAALLALQVETLYATSPRMYMTLQFFTVLAAYSAWRGYIQGSAGFKVIAVIAVICAVFSHDQGAALVVALPLAVVLVAWVLRRRLISLLTYRTFIGLIAIAGATGFVVLYTPLNVTPLVTAFYFETGSGPLGLRLNPSDWLNSNLGIRELAGYGFGFIPFLGFAAIGILRRRWRDIHPSAIYAVAIITISAAITAVGTSEVSVRMWFFVLPFYELLAAMAGAYLIGRYRQRVLDWLGKKTSQTQLAAISLLTPVVVVIAVAGFYALASSYAGEVSRIVGPPCQGNDCDIAIRNHYAQIRADILPDDIIISSNPFVTHHYLGRVDGYLRDKAIIGRDRSITRFDYLTDEYFGKPLFDSQDLAGLLNDPRRVWVITDERVAWISSEETMTILESEYIQHRADEGILTTFVNCHSPPCSRASTGR